MNVVVIEDLAALQQHVPAWEGLAAATIEPNVFYEPWLLLPALRTLCEGRDILVALVFQTNPSRPKDVPMLCGLFPLERRRRYKGIPVKVLSLLEHRYCFICTPLLRTGHGREALAAFFEWARSDPQGGALVELKKIPAEGRVYQLLVDHMHSGEYLSFVSELYTRAFLHLSKDAEKYLQSAISTKHRGDLRRREKHLRERGALEYVTLGPGDDAEAWANAFLTLEAAGWKGQEGTAMACRESDRLFFLEMAKEAFRRGRLLMFGTRLDGRPIALNCYLRAEAGCYFFKPAYDEAFAASAPGKLLEVETIRRLHALPGIEWIDSCTSPENEMLNKLWQNRRTITTVIASTGRSPGDLMVSLSPLFRWLNRRLSRRGSVKPIRSAEGAKATVFSPDYAIE